MSTKKRETSVNIVEQIVIDVAYLPRNIELSEIDQVLKNLKGVYQKLKNIIDSNNSTDIEKIREGYEKLSVYLYTSTNKQKSLMFRVREWFSKGFNQIPDWLRRISSGDPNLHKCLNVNHGGRYVTDSENAKIRILITRQIEDCIYEYLINAYRGSGLANGVGNERVDAEVILSKRNYSYEIELIISNITIERKFTTIPTINQIFFENLGGSVNGPIFKDNNVIIKIYLPMLNKVFTYINEGVK